MTSASTPPSRALLRALAAGSLALCLAATATACTGDEDGGEQPPTDAPAQATDQGAEFEIETRTEFGKVVGRLPAGARTRLDRAVTASVQRWFNAAYVGGDYPRSDFSDAYPGFTPGAREEARRDKRLLTNVGIGERIEEVTPTESRIWIDVVSHRTRPVGVTARFRLKFRTEGDYERRVRVKGRLLLSKQERGWRIFGYEVSRGGRA